MPGTLTEASNTNYTDISAVGGGAWNVGEPGSNNYQVAWFQLDVSSDASIAEQITINVRAYRPDTASGGDDLILGIWNYATNDWEQIDSDSVNNTTTPALLTATLNNASNYVAADGKLTVILFNEDQDGGSNDGPIVVDHVEAIVTKGPTVVDTITDFVRRC